MKTIKVTASKRYDVIIGKDILDEAGFAIRKAAGGQVAAIVTDDNVDALYAERLMKSLETSGYRSVKYVFPHGEASKNTEMFLSLVNFLAKEKLNRTDIVIALGGGVPGDLAGFAAACYKRGIRFVSMPTTLLAAVDSSVGGKTAVNLDAGKNLLGTFYQPDLVLCDVSLLSSLPPGIFRDGCAEVIKYGMIADRSLFEALKGPISERLEDVIYRCVEIKRDTVAKDEFESGTRKLLNFGHTVGHAIEILSGFSISHGSAVAIGMTVETRAAVGMGMCEANCLRGLLDKLDLYGLPKDTTFSAGELKQACLSDKKRDGDFITMVIPVEIGRCVLKELPIDEMEAVIQLGLGS